MQLRFLCLWALLLAACASKPGSPTAELSKKNLVYATVGARELRLDIYYPTTPAPVGGYPLVISIHGGGWIFGDRHKDLFLRKLTDHGYALASIDYRLSGEAEFPAQIDDSRQAMHWLIANAGPLRLRPDRIGVTGASAGGHLALLLGLETIKHNPIKAVCALYPPTDLVAIIPPKNRDRSDNLVAQLLGGPVSEHLALAEEGSPMTYVRKGVPPVLLIHGDKDSLVPISQSEILNKALRRAGATSSLIVYEGHGHGFSLRGETIQTVAEFFDRSLKNRP